MQGRAPSALLPAAAAVVALVLTACGGAASPPPAANKAPDASTPSSVQAAGPAAKVTKAEVALRPKAGAAPTGTATLDQVDEKVTYRVAISGAAAGPHTLYVFAGTMCDTAGNRTGPLNLVEAAADGNGTAEGTIATQLGTLVGRSLALYATDKGDSEIIACGPIAAR